MPRLSERVRVRTLVISAAALVFVLAVVAAAAAATPTHRTNAKAISLTIGANAVVGGKNDLEASWIANYVIPNFEKQQAAAGDPVNVTFQGSGADDEAYKTQLALDLKTGGGPDVFDIDDIWVGEFAQAGYIKPLASVVGASYAKWDGWAVIPKAVKSDMAFQGKQYGIPTGPDGRVIYYNKKLFQRAGIRVPWQPRSWADIMSTARKLKAKLPGVTPLQWNAGEAMGEATTAQGFLPLLAGTGKLIYDTPKKKWLGNTKNIREVLGFYQQVYRGKNAVGDPNLQLIATGRDKSFQEFSQAKIAMLTEGDYLWRSVINPTVGIDPMPTRNSDIGWALIPSIKPHQGVKGPAFKKPQSFVSLSGGGGRVINPHTSHAKEAWALLTFMNSKESWLKYVANQRRITPRADVNRQTLYSDPLLSYVARNVLPITTYRPGFAVYPQVSVLLQLASQQVVAGTSVKKAAQNYQKALVKLVGAKNVESS